MADELSDWRAEIDEIDSDIVELMRKRIELCGRIGDFKHERNLEIDNGEREKEIIKRLKEESDLEPGFIDELFEVIFRESKRVQNEAKE